MQVYINVTPLFCAINTTYKNISPDQNIMGGGSAVLLHGIRVVAQSFLKTNLILLTSAI